jgi:hypothetical protein
MTGEGVGLWGPKSRSVADSRLKQPVGNRGADSYSQKLVMFKNYSEKNVLDSTAQMDFPHHTGGYALIPKNA